MSDREKISRKHFFTFSSDAGVGYERNEKVALSQQKEDFLNTFT